MKPERDMKIHDSKLNYIYSTKTSSDPILPTTNTYV